MKLVKRQQVTYGNSQGCLLTYSSGGKNPEKWRIRYILRAGKKGTGRQIASATCRWGCIPQTRAMDKIQRQAGKITIVEED